MKIAVVGGGGREHALVRKLSQSEKCDEIVAIPGNGGIAAQFPCVAINPAEIDKIISYFVDNDVEYVVVAPDDPLALGLVDVLAERGIPAFGPGKMAAQIEASKIFAKDLMKKYDIPTAGYESFDNSKDALSYIGNLRQFPIVVKADGLALGKGVLICQTMAEAQKAVSEMMEERTFGAAGSRIVVEEFMSGPEVSVLAFCDGETLVPMVSSMDHKRALDGDTGKNTGGMGAVAPNPCYTDDIAVQCMETIFLPTVRAMANEGRPFKGCLYFGLMITQDGPKVIEYNCRFGDPESQVVLPLLESDLLEIMLACTNGGLRQDMVQFAPKHAACVVMASGGYPEGYKTGHEITGVEEAEKLRGVMVYHAGTRLERGEFKTAGGRVLCVSAVADALPEALFLSYKGVEKITFSGCHYRKDIGKTALSMMNQ